MITNTLSESLELQSRFTLMYDMYFKEEDEDKKEKLMREILRIRKRIYKLPNYNISGLEKIMKFLAPYTKKEVNA